MGRWNLVGLRNEKGWRKTSGKIVEWAGSQGQPVLLFTAADRRSNLFPPPENPLVVRHCRTHL